MGGKMMITINDMPLSLYRAEMLEYKIGACDYANGYFLPPTSMIPVKLPPQIGMRSLMLTIDFSGEKEIDAMLAISKITANLQSGAEIRLPDGFIYSCVFEAASAPVQKAPWIWQVRFSLSGYRHGQIEKVKLTQSDSIFVIGTYKTPAIIKITTSSSSVTVMGITVSNITSTDPIVIDGISKKVTQSGSNKFGDTDLVKFPMLEIGYNAVTIEGTAAVEVSYYPIFM